MKEGEMKIENVYSPASVFAKMAAVYGDIKTLQKDSQNSFHKYQYLSEAAIKAALLPLFAKHKLVFRFVRFSDVQTFPHKTRNGESTKFRATAHFEFGCAETGAREPVEFMIEAIDDQDKGFQKLLTNAQKYVLFGTFMLPTGDPRDDAEHDDNERGRAESQAEQKQENRAPVIEPEIRELWAQIRNKQTAVSAIEKWRELLGDDVYSGLLKLNGIESAEQVKTITDARTIVMQAYRTNRDMQKDTAEVAA